MLPGSPHKSDLATPRSVLLIGGGRWGRVHAGILCKLLPASARILWVSEHNLPQLARHVAEQDLETPQISLLSSLEPALAQKPDAALIVTAAFTHVAFARATLEKGIPTFVEKPLALDERDAQELVELAARAGVVFGVGLHLFLASYLHYFHLLWRVRPVVSCQLTWFDVENEIRYGEMKKADIWTNKVHDVFPHLWTILRVFFPCVRPAVRNAAIGPLGAIALTLDAGAVAIQAELGRRAPARARRIALRFADGGNALLDYTCEPGTIEVDGKAVTPDPAWAKGQSPLMAEIAAFFRACAHPEDAARWPCRAANVLDSVTGALAAADRAAGAAALIVARNFAAGADFGVPVEVRHLLVDNIAPQIHELRSQLEDREPERLIVTAAAAILRTPRVVHGALGAGAARPLEVPAELFEAVLRSDFLQRVLAAGLTAI
jgi:predicted dehydrogenase